MFCFVVFIVYMPSLKHVFNSLPFFGLPLFLFIHAFYLFIYSFILSYFYLLIFLLLAFFVVVHFFTLNNFVLTPGTVPLFFVFC